MIPLNHYRDDNVLVVGFGKSGQSAARALIAGGARVAVWDDDEAKRATAGSDGFEPVDARRADLSVFDEVIWSPGIPHTFPQPHPLAEKAKAAGHTLRCDVDLFGCRPTGCQIHWDNRYQRKIDHHRPSRTHSFQLRLTRGGRR